jgi:cytidine deaminase
MEESLKRLLKNSYSPYSGFRVAAICLMKDGKSFGGVNIENASYGATICAERNAINAAISNGYKKGTFSELHVMVDSDKAAYPCFVCRQMIIELFSKDAIIRAYATDGRYVEHTVEELCPYPFDSEDLK